MGVRLLRQIPFKFNVLSQKAEGAPVNFLQFLFGPHSAKPFNELKDTELVKTSAWDCRAPTGKWRMIVRNLGGTFVILSDEDDKEAALKKAKEKNESFPFVRCYMLHVVDDKGLIL